jgi:hypothetical protein
VNFQLWAKVMYSLYVAFIFVGLLIAGYSLLDHLHALFSADRKCRVIYSQLHILYHLLVIILMAIIVIIEMYNDNTLASVLTTFASLLINSHLMDEIHFRRAFNSEDM